ncbi:MAG TPA: peptide transporter [Armatimonadota bacterium]|nr:peptide transporter [Armatimonadota bacterium]
MADKKHVDDELELYRGLMDEPTEFEEGFGGITIIGALFIGFVMLPGAIYLGLVAGASMGPAAEWTTIILFTEIARRSFMTLSRQQVYILFYVAAALASASGGLHLAGGVFAGKIWDAYFIGSPAARGLGIADQIPNWVCPAADSPALLKRTFFHQDWLLPVSILLLGQILGRMNWFGLGYVLFRVTSDIERLPFPFAAIQAQGATALAESTTKSETWRWRMFSIGSMMGLVFGVFYLGIPTLTGAVLNKPLQLIPIPFVDLTRNTQRFLPATPTGFVCDLGPVLAGFVVPFWAVVGAFLQACVTLVLCPTLFKMNILQHWRPGMDTIETSFANSIDFFFSIGIGVSFAVAVVGMFTVTQALIAKKRDQHAATEASEPRWTPPPGRGDVPISVCLGMWIVSTIGYVALCAVMIPKFPIIFVVFFGFIFTPLNSYIDARMLGLTGQWAGLPMVKEGTIILSGYKGVDIWFAPIPNFDHGGQAMKFRVVELTGTRITGLIKAELLILPISVFCSLLFWQFIWRLAPIPSVNYPYAQKMWHLSALQRGLWMTATFSENNLFSRAFYWPYVFGGFGFGIVTYTALSALRLPTLLVYGIMRGLGQLPHGLFPEMVGALLSRFYFEKKYGRKRWKQQAAVLNAGYACGMGLIGMGTVAIALIAKSVSQLPY